MDVKMQRLTLANACDQAGGKSLYEQDQKRRAEYVFRPFIKSIQNIDSLCDQDSHDLEAGGRIHRS